MGNRNKLKTLLGFYSPSFIRMHVDTTESLLNLRTLDNIDAESIYLHEYCHFIQDISTTFGLSNISMIVDYMKYANNHIIDLPYGGFDVPIIPVANNHDNVHANQILQMCYLGGGEDDQVTLVAHRKKRHTLNTRYGIKNPDYVEVDYTTTDGTHSTFEFGALCIIENMAYIIETECYSTAPSSPDLPYRSAEMLVNLIYPAFGLDRLNILALCDATLQAFNPASLFYDTLLRYSISGTLPHTPEDIYTFVGKNQVNYHDQVKLLSQLITDVGSDAVNQIGGYFNDIRMNPVRDWLRDLVSLGIRYRIAHPTFPLAIARGGRIRNNFALADYMNNIGSPLVTNSLGEVTIFDTRVSPIVPNYATIWAINQIHQVLEGNQRNCELVEFCSQSNIPTDARCTTAPWSKNLQPSCAFGQMWRHWGLSDYFPS